jgi:hypothetical protein
MTYTAAILTNASRDILVEKFKNWATGNFEIIAHHVTMYMGSIKPNDKHLLGKEVQIKIVSIASDDKVIALGVIPIGFNSNNKNPHITFAVDRTAGGKPVMSNNLEKWNPISPFILNAIIEESP